MRNSARQGPPRDVDQALLGPFVVHAPLGRIGSRLTRTFRFLFLLGGLLVGFRLGRVPLASQRVALVLGLLEVLFDSWIAAHALLIATGRPPETLRYAALVTLDTLGRPLRDLRISVTDRCNFRCVYCMPKEVFGRDYRFLERRELLTFEEIERMVRAFVRRGVQKIRLTGGEPLVRRDLEQLVSAIAAVPGVRDLTLTTNGVLLPSVAAKLRSAARSRNWKSRP